MPTDRPKYHLVNDEDFQTFLEGLDYMKDRSLNSGAFERADDLERRAEAGPLVAVEIHHTDEWAGLYVDGKLVVHGDSYLASERLQSMVGATDSYDGDWLMPDGRTPLATVEEVHARKADREANQQTAEEKVAEAKRLIEEAEALTGQKVSLA